MIAQRRSGATGVNRFEAVAYDTVAAIVNDLACVGALPLVVNAYFATGDSAWYANRERATQLLEGWQQACVDAGATWGGGESPALAGLVTQREIELAGAAIGALPDGSEPLPETRCRRRRNRARRLDRPSCQRSLARPR